MQGSLALVTGADGEMGHALIPELRRRGVEVVALDLRPIGDELRAHCSEFLEASILDEPALDDLFRRHRFSHVFHLAAVLSSQAERKPEHAHRVNVEGSFGLFRRCRERRSATDLSPRFLFPSSIAVYGLPDAGTKERHGAVRETEWLVPTGMYGCNKLYCELIGNYLSRGRLDEGAAPLDFRSIRFPGLISAETLPSGGTTDYAPEMLHSAAQGLPYECFVEERTRLPFMIMPDAVEALLALADAPAESLTSRVYNIKAFSVSAGELRRAALEEFPDAEIRFVPNPAKQAIVDSWPADVDDSLARRDWGLQPRHGLAEALGDYLVPALRRRYDTTPG